MSLVITSWHPQCLLRARLKLGEDHAEILDRFWPALLRAAWARTGSSKYGADDTLGAVNHLSPQKVVQAARLVKTGKTYPLGVVTGWDTPAYPPRQYAITVIQPGQDSGPTMGANRATGNDDLLYTWMGIGSQLDGLGHMGEEHVYYNGHKASDFVTPKGLKALSIDKIPPIVTRGVLLDMTRHFDANPLPAGTVFNEKEIKAQAAAQGVAIEKGDVVLFHTGWQNLADTDPVKFMSGEPGLGWGGAAISRQPRFGGRSSDTWGVGGRYRHEDPTLAFPVNTSNAREKRHLHLGELGLGALAARRAGSSCYCGSAEPRFRGRGSGR